MAVNNGSLRERVSAAWSAMHVLHAEEMPSAEMRSKFERLFASLTKIKDLTGDRGHMHVTLEAATDNDLRDMAQLVVDLYEGSLKAKHHIDY